MSVIRSVIASARQVSSRQVGSVPRRTFTSSSSRLSESLFVHRDTDYNNPSVRCLFLNYPLKSLILRLSHFRRQDIEGRDSLGESLLIPDPVRIHPRKPETSSGDYRPIPTAIQKGSCHASFRSWSEAEQRMDEYQCHERRGKAVGDAENEGVRGESGFCL
jgi:hypothetical protein